MTKAMISQELCDATVITSLEGSWWERQTALARRAWQRGMATAEYAVGILAAVALALVLLNIFNDNEFFSTLLKFVVDLIGRAGQFLP